MSGGTAEQAHTTEHGGGWIWHGGAEPFWCFEEDECPGGHPESQFEHTADEAEYAAEHGEDSHGDGEEADEDRQRDVTGDFGHGTDEH